MGKIQDSECIRQLQEGNESAFTAIYEQYWASLFKYVIRILPEEDEVADVVQETFVTFWELRNRLAKVRSIKAYLFIMARNLAFRRFRENLRQETAGEHLVEFYANTEVSMELTIELKDLADLIDAEIGRLPEKMREVFVLSRKEHLSYQEIAERLEISDETVKKQISRALKYLRVRMDKSYIPYLTILMIIDVLG
ncbi:RNA polymerase sigma factor [Olivibacter domesticus]|uniref:RNA polymerase sigma-70 factor, ECF subfamily n=1 Tax=Olivibacter domesticus TaxID=407022 RepID=A0A1H7UC29_OLID1|nr:RNA polymerase sigma-70 factor [Olivibacter domesticus]SEL94573.1 RNA polymerase sigma-70 factor, ECF subfamily [Olivibacter domesticus]